MLLNAVGVVGFLLMLADSAAQSVDLSQRHRYCAALQFVSLAATVVFVMVHIAHFQRALALRITRQIDAWFVLLQVTVVMLCVCDVFLWDARAIVIATAWVWCLWMLFLDALPPSTRSHLTLSRSFIWLVSGGLLVFPVWLTATLYFPKDPRQLRNRILLRLQIAEVVVEFPMLTFISSRLFTLWVWMVRVFWRELLRPPNAFQFIKYGVHFQKEV